MRIRKRGWMLIGLTLLALVVGGIIVWTAVDPTDEESREALQTATEMVAGRHDNMAWQRVPPTARPLWETLFHGAR